MHRFASSPVASVLKFRPLAGALVLALAFPAAHAASLGHSHLVSVLGQPLQIDVQLRELTADDQRSLAVQSAPAQAWAQSGLTPPVDPSSLHFHIVDGYAPGTKVIQIRSAQAFDQPVADLLIDVNTAAGRQRFQVSMLTQGSQAGAVGHGGSARAGQGARASQSGKSAEIGKSIRVKWGDTMFSIAQRHAVPGVTVYQMMIALQRANPKAFIDGNLNLVKSGATLKMPSMAALTAISDREARRLFVEQAQAFALYSQRTAASATAAGGASAASGAVTTGADGAVVPKVVGEAPRDQLRLSGGANGSGAGSAADRADDAVSARKGIEESSTRLSQLEANVRDLNKALQAQGDAAGNLVLEGAHSLGSTLSAQPAGQGSAGAGQDVANASQGAARASEQQTQVAGSSAGTQAGKDGAGQNGLASGQVNAATGAGVAGAGGKGAADAAGTGNTSAGSAVPGNVGAGNNTGAGVSGAATTAADATGAAGSGSGATGQGAAGSSATGSGAVGSGAAGSGATGSGAVGSGATGSGATGSGATGSGATGSGATGSGATGSGATGSGATGSGATGSGATGSGAAGSGAAGSGATGSGATGSGAADSSAAGPGQSASGIVGSNGTGSTSSTVAGSQAQHASETGAAPGNASGIESAGVNGSGSGSAATGAADGSAGTNSASAVAGAGAAKGTTNSISSKADKTVSWLQEHTLGVITGVLALIVLIIAWLLRRANTVRNDGTDGVITEAMVQEKLNQIDFDFTEPPAGGARPPKR
ncbi:hypothetical protein H0A71_13310 [Alcaligenaceae bacterium]|nr:hypothetical protein [Alcaligenaceae bacterium]